MRNEEYGERKVAVVLISDPGYYHKTGDPENVLHPLRHIRVIMENGAMFARTFECVNMTEDLVAQNYEDEFDQWKRLEPNKTER